jgi:hypothetical protein
MRSKYQLEVRSAKGKRKKFKAHTNKRWIKERRRIDRKELKES